MGLFDFIKGAGSSVFGGDDEKQEPVAVKPFATHLKECGIDCDPYTFNLKQGHLTVEGEAPSQDVKETVIVTLGNVHGVSTVDDRITVAQTIEPTADSEPAVAGAEATPADWQSDTCTVQSGDSLSKIAKTLYGDASKYRVIFEANTPMLKDPDKIYPGQSATHSCQALMQRMVRPGRIQRQSGSFQSC